MYVDYLSVSVSDRNFAVNFVKTSRELMRKGGMDLCNFMKNLDEIDKFYPISKFKQLAF